MPKLLCRLLLLVAATLVAVPAMAADKLSSHDKQVYEQAFANLDIGRGSAVAVVMFAILVAAMTAYFSFLRKEPS